MRSAARTASVGGRFSADFWSSPVRTPPLYPDAVTLRAEIAAEQLLSEIDLSEGCSVKDSFADLDLTFAGFCPLFRAEWLLRDAKGTTGVSDREWCALTTGEQLMEWESAWADSSEAVGFFRPGLLADAAIGVLARYDGGRIVAGAIANRSAAVIGLSNVFDAAGDLESAWFGGARGAQAIWGQMPVVSYDSGASLGAAHRAGFGSIGELVVWLIPPTGSHSP